MVAAPGTLPATGQAAAKARPTLHADPTARPAPSALTRQCAGFPQHPVSGQPPAKADRALADADQWALHAQQASGLAAQPVLTAHAEAEAPSSSPNSWQRQRRRPGAGHHEGLGNAGEAGHSDGHSIPPGPIAERPLVLPSLPSDLGAARTSFGVRPEPDLATAKSDYSGVSCFRICGGHRTPASCSCGRDGAIGREVLRAGLAAPGGAGGSAGLVPL